MAKTVLLYVCQACGTQHSKWSGKCEDCGAWNTLAEDKIFHLPKGLGRIEPQQRLTLHTLDGPESPDLPRYASSFAEFDRVTGGGLVPGSVVLVGGDPGIGKSTLLLQVAADLARTHSVFYVSGEEGVPQIRLRAGRLGVAASPLTLVAATHLRDIIATLDTTQAPTIVIIDSIQTMFVDSVESSPGTVTQVRLSTQELIQLAKRRNMTIILVGHVTKEGTIAGPRVLEHMVDAVLYFEGERGYQFRILRGVKNRFGPTDEIGVFEMTQAGLQEVTNPSGFFLPDEASSTNGTSIFAGMEGSRPLLMEIQCLVAPSTLGMPRRTLVGWDAGRLSMILAVLEARAGLSFAGKDIFLNIAGGLKIQEPAADLAVAAALLSAASGDIVPLNRIFFGEISLSGDIRSVPHVDTRLKEAAKLGFEEAFIPPLQQRKKTSLPLTCHTIRHIKELVATFSFNT